MARDYTPQELMAVFIARDLRDGEVLRVGVAMPVVEAAVRLAHVMHGPNMELIFLGARMNVAHLHSLPMPAFGLGSSGRSLGRILQRHGPPLRPGEGLGQARVLHRRGTGGPLRQ